jgi:hypothetical protein
MLPKFRHLRGQVARARDPVIHRPIASGIDALTCDGAGSAPAPSRPLHGYHSDTGITPGSTTSAHLS